MTKTVGHRMTRRAVLTTAAALALVLTTGCRISPLLSVSEATHELAWIDLTGRVRQVVPESAATYGGIWLRSDDRSAIVALASQSTEGIAGQTIWDLDLSSGRVTRAESVEEALSGRGVTHWADGDFVYNVRVSESDVDVGTSVGGVSAPFLANPWRQRDGQWAADRHWIAYVSEESGTPEVYVQTFPDSSRGRWLVSLPDGGEQPVWRSDSTMLYYWAPGGHLMAVPMKKGRELTQPLEPKLVFTVPFGPAAFAVSMGGDRLLMAIPRGHR